MAVSRGAINRWYEDRMYDPYSWEYYDQSSFFNFGYWEEETVTQREACENLMERLLAFLPQRQGRILDVACGKGATTAYLLRSYSPDQVVGLDLSLKQLATCQATAPGVPFLLMSAPTLGLAENSFDAVICVEAVFHFDTREAFLGEALRVLKPGGRLILTDILMTRWGDRGRNIRTERNYVADLAAYRRLFQDVGFREVQVVDASLESWVRFYRHMLRWHWQEVLWRHGDLKTFLTFLGSLALGKAAVRHYLLVAATKPA